MVIPFKFRLCAQVTLCALCRFITLCIQIVLLQPIIIIIIIIIYSIYRALISNGPKALYIIENNDKILNLQNYIVIL